MVICGFKCPFCIFDAITDLQINTTQTKKQIIQLFKFYLIAEGHTQFVDDNSNLADTRLSVRPDLF